MISGKFFAPTPFGDKIEVLVRGGGRQPLCPGDQGMITTAVQAVSPPTLPELEELFYQRTRICLWLGAVFFTFFRPVGLRARQGSFFPVSRLPAELCPGTHRTAATTAIPGAQDFQPRNHIRRHSPGHPGHRPDDRQTRWIRLGLLCGHPADDCRRLFGTAPQCRPVPGGWAAPCISSMPSPCTWAHAR